MRIRSQFLNWKIQESLTFANKMKEKDDNGWYYFLLIHHIVNGKSGQANYRVTVPHSKLCCIVHILANVVFYAQYAYFQYPFKCLSLQITYCLTLWRNIVWSQQYMIQYAARSVLEFQSEHNQHFQTFFEYPTWATISHQQCLYHLHD